jgi:hypothetical protein
MAIDYMIEASLRRPRFLIDLMERTLSFAINRGHKFVAPEDVEEGARQMSLYLVSDFAYEMRDIAGTPEDIFYRFRVSQNFSHTKRFSRQLRHCRLPYRAMTLSNSCSGTDFWVLSTRRTSLFLFTIEHTIFAAWKPNGGQLVTMSYTRSIKRSCLAFSVNEL